MSEEYQWDRNQTLAYRNRVSELNKLDNSLGEIVVIDALTGYGKTAFLQETARRRKAQDWLTQYIPLTRGMLPSDVWTTTVRELSGNHTLSLQGLDDALARLSYFLPHGKRLAVLFDDVHSLQNETLTWVQTEFAPKLKEELLSISQGNCLLIFSGQNMPVSVSWPPHRRMNLLPFDRNTIQQFVDTVPNPQLQEFLKSARHKKWLIEKMIHLCGGHPRAFLQILQKIETGAWCPHPRLPQESDRTIFERYVETEINQLMGGLNDSYRQILEYLSIFRSVNSNIVKTIQADEQVQNQENPLTVISNLKKNNLLIAKELILDPVIRNGLMTRMMLNNRHRYIELNQLAQRAHQNWLSRFSEERPFEEAQAYAAEAIYHCLCHSNQPRDLQECLRGVVRRLDELLDAQSAEGINSTQILIEHLAYDEDIVTMLSDYDWSIEQQIREMNCAQLPIASSQPEYTDGEYTSGIVEVLASDGVGVGTGFLLLYQEQWLIVTCTHILQQINLSPNSTVHLNHFHPEIGKFEAEAIKFEPPTTPSSQWNAYEDVSVLRPVRPFSSQLLNPYPLHSGPMHSSGYPSGQQSLCFGYAQDRFNRGDYILGLTFAHEVASGFIALTNRGATRVRPGVSGAPLANVDTQTIVGMVQSVTGNGDQAYLIPASIIGRTISEVLS